MGQVAVGVSARLRPPVFLGVKLFLMNEAGEVLLIKTSYAPGFVLPGGGVEPGETCLEAALREGREEGGVSAAETPELFQVYLNRAFENRNHVVMYVARGAADPAARSAKMEVVAAGFFAPDALPEDVTDATRRRIREVTEGLPPAPYW
ncbi:MAG: NUDIX domain-containing protein [Pseudomonadota bacterium]